jgi:two-component system cell cycle response regulator
VSSIPSVWARHGEVRKRNRSPLADRLFVLQSVRLLDVAAMLLVPALVGLSPARLVPTAIPYLFFVGTVELGRRRAPTGVDAVLPWTVLFDGFVVVVAVALTGGFHSPLLFLVFLDVMAVTLVVSYRTGLKLATWCALLLLLAHAASDAGVLAIQTVVSDRVAVVSALTFLFFAVCTAAFSSVNERSLRDVRAQLESLVALGAQLEWAQRHDDVMGALVRYSRERLGFARAAVLVRRGHHWSGVCDDGSATTLLDAQDRATPIISETWSTGTPMLVSSIDDDLLDLVVPHASNVVVAPVAIDDTAFGVAVAEWGGGQESRIPVLTVHAFAEASMHAALALRNADLLREVERLATRDALTGVANRRLFDESLEREIARAARLVTPLSLIVLDVDHFKQVNDSYGHQTGDLVLREVADALVSQTKALDVVARLGGDEFVILLPGCAHDDALGVAERVRRELARRGGNAPMTMSAGVATYPLHAVDGDALVSAADASLYEAKRRGRDCVVGQSDLPVPD